MLNLLHVLGSPRQFLLHCAMLSLRGRHWAYCLTVVGLLLGSGIAWPLHAQTPVAPAALAPASFAEQAQGLRQHLTLHDVDPDRLRPLERLTRQAVEQVQQELMTRLSGDLYVEYVGSPEAFKQVTEAHGAPGWPENWIAGLALLDQDRIVVQVNGPGALLTSETVRHELAHVALHALSGGAPLPRWYHEGVAMYLSGEATFERLRDQNGAAAFGELDSLHKLNVGFGNDNQVAANRAYAVAAGFVRFAVNRVGDKRAVLFLQARMRGGLDFTNAFTATFGTPPEPLFQIYAAYIGQHASQWSLLVSDAAVWGLISVLALWAMLRAWRNRPKFESEDGDEPLDLEAIAAAGRAALRPWRQRDFADQPLAVTDADDPPADTPEEEPTVH